RVVRRGARDRVDADFFPPRFQVSGTALFPADAGDRGDRRCADGRRGATAGDARGALPARRGWRRIAVRHLGTSRTPSGGWLLGAGGRSLLDQSDSVLRGHEASAGCQATRGGADGRVGILVPASLSAAGSHHVARPAIQYRLPIWRGFSRGGGAG